MRSLFMGDANNSFSVVIAATARRQRGLARSPRGHRSSQVIELSAQCPVNGEGNLSMKNFAIRLTLAGAMLSSVAHAQATIHMSRATCTEYLAMPPAQSADFSARMSGW
jgi:hypothetical protein